MATVNFVIIVKFVNCRMQCTMLFFCWDPDKSFQAVGAEVASGRGSGAPQKLTTIWQSYSLKLTQIEFQASDIMINVHV